MSINTDWDADWRADVAARAAQHPNPPCLSWCQTGHDPAEFASSGGLICGQPIGDGPGWSVAVEGSRWVADEFRLWGPLGPVRIEVLLRDGIGGGHLEAVAPGQAAALGNALVDAARFCAMRGDR